MGDTHAPVARPAPHRRQQSLRGGARLGPAASAKREFGPVAAVSDAFDFTETNYYAAEMGVGLKKQFWAFAAPIDPGRLAAIKLHDQLLGSRVRRPRPASRAAAAESRPGYLTLAKLVLASTKDHAHRIYLADGIYAEVTLSFRGGGWQPFEWTYPDYRRADFHEFFTRCRESCAAAPRKIDGADRRVRRIESLRHLNRAEARIAGMKTTLSFADCGGRRRASSAESPSVTGKLGPGRPGRRRRRLRHANPATLTITPTDGAAANANAPLIAVPETTFHFGNMESGTTQRHEFPVRNRGRRAADRRLRLAHVQVHRGAAERQAQSSQAPRSSSPPGERSVDHARMGRQGRRRAVPPRRHVHHERSRLSRDWSSRSRAKSSRATTLEPSQLSFGSRPRRPAGHGRAGRHGVSGARGRNSVARSARRRSSPSGCKVSVEPRPPRQAAQPKGQGRRQGRRHVRPGRTRSGRSAVRCELETNLKQAPRASKCPIYGTVKGDISIFGNGWNEADGVLRMVPVVSAEGGSTQLYVNIRGEHAATTEADASTASTRRS